MHTARPVFLDFADRQDLARPPATGSIASTSTPPTSRRPSDPPRRPIAWAATIDEHTDTAALALREALSGQFGTP
jgi:hypothetical protein